MHRGGGGTDDGAVGGGDGGGEADVDVVVDPVVIHLDVVEMAHCVVVICVSGMEVVVGALVDCHDPFFAIL